MIQLLSSTLSSNPSADSNKPASSTKASSASGTCSVSHDVESEVSDMLALSHGEVAVNMSFSDSTLDRRK